MKIKLFALRVQYERLSDRHKPIALSVAAFITLFVVIFLFKGCQAIALNKKRQEVVPLMIKQGNHILVPEHSALRNELKLTTVTKSKLPHIISVPGWVEINPTQQVNISPPLTGRIVSLKVDIGDRVIPNQVLALLSSPDLSQGFRRVAIWPPRT